MIPYDVLKVTWPYLLVLLYLLVTCSMTVLGSYFRHAIRVHDLIRESKAKRLEYRKSLEDRIDEDEDEDSNVAFDAVPQHPSRRQAA